MRSPNFDQMPTLSDDEAADLMNAMASYRNDAPFAAANAAFRSALPPAPARVCEIGPGAGEDADELTAAGYDVVGVDVRADLRQPGSSWPLVLADAAHLPFAENAFDAVVANRVLHHTPDARQVLRRARGVVRPGGVVVFVVPSPGTFTCHRPGANAHVRRLYTTPSLEVVNPMSVPAAMDAVRDAGLILKRVEVHSRRMYGRSALAYAMSTKRVTFTDPEAQRAVADLANDVGWATLDLVVVVAVAPST